MLQRRSGVGGGGSVFAALAALVTTLCCLGVPSLVGLLSAVGAGFLVSDRYLAPLLAGTLLLTLLIAGLHLRRHRQPGPFMLSLIAAGSVFFAVYGIWTPWLAYGAIVVLLVAQVWDLALYRRCAQPVTAVPTHAASVSSGT